MMTLEHFHDLLRRFVETPRIDDRGAVSREWRALRDRLLGCLKGGPWC